MGREILGARCMFKFGKKKGAGPAKEKAEKPDRALELYRKALTLDLSPNDRRNIAEMVAELEEALAAEEGP